MPNEYAVSFHDPGRTSRTLVRRNEIGSVYLAVEVGVSLGSLCESTLDEVHDLSDFTRQAQARNVRHISTLRGVGDFSPCPFAQPSSTWMVF
jgi:hypothetical protein